MFATHASQLVKLKLFSSALMKHSIRCSFLKGTTIQGQNENEPTSTSRVTGKVSLNMDTGAILLKSLQVWCSFICILFTYNNHILLI